MKDSMSTYEASGVNVEMGDKCSAIAYNAAKETFIGRKGMIGQPVVEDGGFTGTLDMGDYFLVQNDDGVGSKMQVAEMMGKYDTMGTDLLCMVIDDAVCIGAEPISVTNTIDVDKVDEAKIAQLMEGLKEAALKHKVVIPGGEIAEMGKMCNGYIWNATCVGIVEKNKVINGQNIKIGDKLIGLLSPNFRSNGLSLVRHILSEKFGTNWVNEKYDDNRTWGEVVIEPSKIYASAIMEMHGRYKESAKVELKGVCHITGGGIPGNLPRILKKTGLNYKLTTLPKPPPAMQKLMELGNVSEDEAYKTWNMGVGMILVSDDFEKISAICKNHGIEAQIIGEVL
ncbi:phosphoribosylformylglycinamidine cyclo-ligase [Candidatus Peregrinibacteria bacterium]|nr:phosphoribosylformylglycinamidine cyclo-ligase [Candidatus Peregrinibacteria bacterium]